MTRRLFIDNLGVNTTKEKLEELFKVSGSVESVVIPLAKSIKEKINHAFVVMETEYAASQAIHRLNNREWHGQRLTVTQAGPVARTSLGFSGGPARTATKTR